MIKVVRSDGLSRTEKKVRVGRFLEQSGWQGSNRFEPVEKCLMTMDKWTEEFCSVDDPASSGAPERADLEHPFEVLRSECGINISTCCFGFV